MEGGNIELREEFVNKDQEETVLQEPQLQPSHDEVDIAEYKEPEVEKEIQQPIQQEQLNGYINSKFDNPFEDSNEESPLSDREEKRMSRVPVDSYETTLAYIETFDQNDEKIIKAFKDIGPEKLERFLDNLFTLSNIHSGKFGTKIVKENITNNNKVGDIDLGVRTVEFKNNAKNLSTKSAIARFQSIIGLSNTITVSLYHSGFTIGLSAPTQAELNTLHMEIYSETLDVGRNTSAFIASHKRGGAVRIMRDYIKSKIVSCSLSVDFDDVFKYISILDFDSILLGLLAATYVDSIVVSRTCKNSQVIDETGSVKCMHTIRSELNPRKMLFVNKDMLTNDMAMTISKRTTGSVTMEERDAYISSLNNILENKRKIKKDVFLGNFKGNELYVEFKIPTVDEFVEESDIWVEETKLQLDELIDKTADIKRSNALESIMANKILTNINATITGFLVRDEYGNESKHEDREFIRSILVSLSGEMGIVEDVLIKLKEFLNESTISIVAINKFICPSCKEENSEEDTPSAFEDFIPLNMLDFLFTLVGDRTIRLSMNKEIKSSTL